MCANEAPFAPRGRVEDVADVVAGDEDEDKQDGKRGNKSCECCKGEANDLRGRENVETRVEEGHGVDRWGSRGE